MNYTYFNTIVAGLLTFFKTKFTFSFYGIFMASPAIVFITILNFVLRTEFI